MSLKLDLHVHTKSRGRVFIDAVKLREVLKRRGLDGIAVTNFFDISHGLELKDKLKEFNMIVGQEIWTKEGHIIGLGLKERIADFLSPSQTIDAIHLQGGLAVAVHPFLPLGLGKILSCLDFDAIESFNALIGSGFFPNYLAKLAAKRFNMVQLAGSDTTSLEFIGHSFTEVFTNGDDSVLNTIKQGKVRLHRKPLPFPAKFFLKNLLNFKNFEPCHIHAVPCLECGKSMAVRIFKKELLCLDCGRLVCSRILCSGGHFICLDCVMKRETKQE